jgi:spore coat protein A
MQKRAIPGLALALAGLVLAAPAARSETVTLDATRDNTLLESATGALSNGAGDSFYAGRTNQTSALDARRAVLAFDVAGTIPAGSTITAATLTLRLNKTRDTVARTLTLHRLTADWGEGASVPQGNEGDGAPAQTGDATWLHTFYPASFWAAAGGDYDGGASASSSVGTANGPYSWTSSALAADVQGWLDAPATDFGWILLGDESTAMTARGFDSRQANNAANRPKLVVTYTPPSSAGACCAASGACGITTAGACGVAGGTYQGDGESCEPNPCPQPTGACCLADGSCSQQTSAGCTAAGGAYHGHGSSCDAVVCPVLTGACCLPGSPGSCAPRTAGACSADGGSFLGLETVCGVDLCPFVDALPLPAVAQPVSGSPGAAATYEIDIVQTEQQLHRDLPPTTVWGYEGSYPGPTIEAAANTPVTVVWRNDLRENGVLREDHLLPVDTCLHGPDEEGDAPRTVVHLHGGHVPPESDGYPEATFLPGEQATYLYLNQQLPATLWYHDHALGITRLNVYLGLAGFYLLREPGEAALGLPSGAHEVALAIQDRDLAADGALVYPAAWQEAFYGDLMLVNGKVWPYLEVPRGKMRLRVLDGANSRALTLALSDGATFHAIGTEGGLLPEPVPLTSITLTPGERADLVFDFAGYPAGTRLELVNSAPAPFPGSPGVGVLPRVMQFRVTSAIGHTAPLPSSLRPLESLAEGTATVTRTFELQKGAAEGPCGLPAWTINGLRWHDVTEYPVLGETEIWRFVNRSGMAHPMHMHLAMFQILDRQAFTVVDGGVVPTGNPSPPAAHEAGWKDTVSVNPSEIVRVAVRFENFVGRYPYHCHVLEHEDHEMMRQFQTVAPELFDDDFETGAASEWSEVVPGS